METCEPQDDWTTMAPTEVHERPAELTMMTPMEAGEPPTESTPIASIATYDLQHEVPLVRPDRTHPDTEMTCAWFELKWNGSLGVGGQLEASTSNELHARSGSISRATTSNALDVLLHWTLNDGLVLEAAAQDCRECFGGAP